MKTKKTAAVIITILLGIMSSGAQLTNKIYRDTTYHYTPAAENLANREKFISDRFGIFLHWGIYSIYGQGEWYMNRGINHKEYAKAADAFYPHRFDAEKWVETIKKSGARYICITTRHHDGFSMWDTKYSDYNIVDATPFGRDIIREIYEACEKHGIALHLYYSHLDWSRTDYYPLGRTGRTTGRKGHGIWSSYYQFMNNQIKELLLKFPKIRAMWFDGWWDHDSDSIPFNWQLEEQYAMIHRNSPGCLVANNHHQDPFEGEDIQIFERDIPGNNHAGLSEQNISTRLPLETCQTMNGMWGYKVDDQNYKSTKEIINLLVRTASKGANLLLNVGPQPNGELPDAAVARLDSIGIWMKRYGKSIYGTKQGYTGEQPWGVSTTDNKNKKLYLHILTPDSIDEESITINMLESERIKSATTIENPEKKLRYQQKGSRVTISLPTLDREKYDNIIEIEWR